MGRADYAHWNEDADYMWWMEEGRHPEEPPEDYDDHTGQYDADYEDEEEVLCHLCEEPLEDGQEGTEFQIEYRGHPHWVLVHKDCKP